MTLEEQLGQMLAVGFEGIEPPDYILDWIRTGQIGGIILFARNVESPEQLARLTQTLHDTARDAGRPPLLIGIDQEGGTVARLREGFTESPGALALGTANDPQLAEEISAMLGREMRALGINWVYAPVVDLTHETALVFEIMQAAFAEYEGILDPPSSVHTETLDDATHAIDEGGAVLAWLGETAVGSARYAFHDDSCYIGRVSVLPEYRGQGIGSAMVEYIEDIARDHGCTLMEITVRLILESNVRLYERLGYRVSEVYQHPKGGGMVGDMTKTL